MSRSPFYDDPKFITLYQQYESSAKALQMAVIEACRILDKESLPGPRRQIDMHKLNQLRRFLERDAYKVFTYDGVSSPPLPPETELRKAASKFKDAVSAQAFGKAGRAEQYISQAQAQVDVRCKQVWGAYSKAPNPRSAESKRALVQAIELAQITMLESETVKMMEKEVQRLHATGQIRPSKQ